MSDIPGKIRNVSYAIYSYRRCFSSGGACYSAYSQRAQIQQKNIIE